MLEKQLGGEARRVSEVTFGEGGSERGQCRRKQRGVGESDKFGGRCRADGRVGVFNFVAWRVVCGEESRGDWASGVV
jgi:hypothetical protein